MKFAVCNETFRDWPIDRGACLRGRLRLHGIEIAPFTLAQYVTEITPRQRAEVRKAADAAGLQVVGLHWLLARTEASTSPVPTPISAGGPPIISPSWPDAVPTWAAR